LSCLFLTEQPFEPARDHMPTATSTSRIFKDTHLLKWGTWPRMRKKTKTKTKKNPDVSFHMHSMHNTQSGYFPSYERLLEYSATVRFFIIRKKLQLFQCLQYHLNVSLLYIAKKFWSEEDFRTSPGTLYSRRFGFWNGDDGMMVPRNEGGTEAKLKVTNSSLEWPAGHMLHEREILIQNQSLELTEVLEMWSKFLTFSMRKPGLRKVKWLA